MIPRRPLLQIALLCAALALQAVASQNAAAQDDTPRIDVFEVKGLVDGPVERSIVDGIRDAEEADAALVALQIDSPGVLGHARLNRITRAIRASKVPVLAWVGPPGAEAANGAALIVTSADMRAIAQASTLGPIETLNMKTLDDSDREATPFDEGLNALDVEEAGVIDVVEPSIDAVLDELDLDFDPDDAQIRFHKLDILGRVLHASAQPSIIYLLLLLALVGVVFELFHPSNGPAGISGLLAGALAIYGVVALGGSWIGVGLIVAGVAFFCVDLRYESLGAFTLGGLVALIAGSLLLFRSPWLRINPWILAFGIVSMVMFLVGAMTRVLRDLRAIARGELEVTDAHAHLEGDDDDA